MTPMDINENTAIHTISLLMNDYSKIPCRTYPKGYVKPHDKYILIPTELMRVIIKAPEKEWITD